MTTFLKKWWKWILGAMTIPAVFAAGELNQPTLALSLVDRIADGYQKTCVERATGKQVSLPLTAEQYATAPLWVPPGYSSCLYASQYPRYSTADGKLPDMTYGDVGGGNWQVVYKGKTFTVPQNVQKVLEQIDVIDAKSTTSTK